VIGRSIDTIQFKFDIFARIAGDLRPSRFWTVIDIYNRDVYNSNLDILSIRAFMPSAKLLAIVAIECKIISSSVVRMRDIRNSVVE
jgi:hypothetical protein